MINLCLIGLGLHAKRIYIGYCKKYNIKPKLIIELDSFENETKKYLKELGWEDICCYFIKEKYRDYRFLPKCESIKLKKIIKTLNITHSIISTEPKGHNMWCEFFMKNNIHVLTDKPITVYDNMLNKKCINLLLKDYNNLLSLQKKHNVQCKVMCQRMYHMGYMYIRNLVEDMIKTYNIPITYMNIYHCDGKWNMPHEYNSLESHPYKFGYGKMFHSGYHFIDLASSLLNLNNFTDESKHMKSINMMATFRTPSDELNSTNVDDYKRFFNALPEEYERGFNFENNGERDCCINMECRNKNNKVISLVNLNLLQSGFSRRSWLKSKKDTYKGNGRLRHESLVIQLGSLMSIHVHSYQSKEISERTDDECSFGGLEHYDIDIYRNVGIIGGKPFERIKLKDLVTDRIKNFIGYNEYAREEGINHFLKNDTEKGELKHHKLAMKMVYNYCLILKNFHKDKKQQIKFKIGDVNG